MPLAFDFLFWRIEIFADTTFSRNGIVLTTRTKTKRSFPHWFSQLTTSSSILEAGQEQAEISTGGQGFYDNWETARAIVYGP